VITLKNITKTYGGAAQVQALKGINLTIDDGEIFGIIGKSGAGKSTLVRCINMLEKPTSGQVIIDDKDLTKMNESQLRAERKNIGMIFQHFNLLSSRTVAENIAFPLELVGASKDVIEKKVASLLDLVGLSDRAGNYPSQLSGRPETARRHSPVPWPAIRKSCSATKPRRPWTRRRRNPSWNCSRTSINAWASLSSSSPMKWPSSRKSAIASPSSKAVSSRKWAASSTSSPILSPRP
jgi:hypothetical protein